jgi:protocatechuate 3,4-dioxygenase alpha subunit
LHLGLRLGVNASPDPDAGPRVVIRGRLLDGGTCGIPDGVIEWWHPSLRVVQRALTSDDGSYVLETVKPGKIPGPEGQDQAPHLAVRVLGRGIQTQYVTRLYFQDEAMANAVDPILNVVPPHRRHSVIARATAANEYRFDVIVQGDQNETVFFDI